jgi:hypothetical protein
MDERAIRSKIVQKLHSGLLAHDLGLPTMGGSGERGETCAACDQPISPSERLSVGYEGLARTRYWFHGGARRCGRRSGAALRRRPSRGGQRRRARAAVI